MSDEPNMDSGERHRLRMQASNNVCLVMDYSDEDDPGTSKVVKAWYASKAEAIMQAEHELGTDKARKRLNDRYDPLNGRMELYPSGVKVVHIEDAKGKVVWTP